MATAIIGSRKWRVKPASCLTKNLDERFTISPGSLTPEGGRHGEADDRPTFRIGQEA
ncbi:MAG TPA: hypothetical protein GX397_02750 [Acetomicrobium hydrogeniformans]|uniref:Uncharacterized protein n=1 Tax=Acetomicrobium hydrogeniformans TaxID=649746 RepID=A0A7V6ZDH4_9BACT|nr:hypothetical protein [Acetomicrobium hydrogeniformans]